MPITTNNTPAGAIFELSRPARESISISPSNEWSAQLVAGSNQIRLYKAQTLVTYDEVFDESVGIAQQALDLIAYRHGLAVVLDAAEDGQICWWTEARGCVLRASVVAERGFILSATATVTDKDGNVVPQPPPPVVPWHASLRYFRLSQAASDLFDAYRNLYLAFEAVLSDLVPQKLGPTGQVAEGEGKWLRRALAEVNKTISLAPYTPGSPDPVDTVFQDLYAGTRTAVFHAKVGRVVFLPHGRPNRADVLSSLDRLSRLYIDLAAHQLGVPRLSSGMTYAGFAMATDFDADIVITDDKGDLEPDATAVNLSVGQVLQFPASKLPLTAPLDSGSGP